MAWAAPKRAASASPSTCSSLLGARHGQATATASSRVICGASPPPPEDGTHVINVEMFAGAIVAMLRPLVARRWNRQFQAALDGLIRNAAGKGTDPAG